MKKYLLFVLALTLTLGSTSQVLNGGFENWSTSTNFTHPDVSPAVFNSVNNQAFFYQSDLGVTEVEGVTGSAIHLETYSYEGDTLAAYGIFGSPPQGDDIVFSDGFPFSDVTVSGVTMDLRYSIDSLSPGFFIVQFLNGGIPVAGGPNDDGTYIFPISGNQSDWTSVSFDFLPYLTQIPDECVLAFACNDLLNDSATFFVGDWLEIDNVEFVGTMMAEVPGGDFDTWMDVNSNTVDDWDTYLPSFIDFISQSDESNSGNYALQLETFELDGDNGGTQAMIYQAELSENGIIPNQPLENNSYALQFYYQFSSPAETENAIVYLLLSDVENPAPEDVFFISVPMGQTGNWIQSTIDFADEMPNASYYGLLFFSGSGFDVDGVAGSVLLLDDVHFLIGEGCDFTPSINEGNVSTCEGGNLELTTQIYDYYEWYGGVEGQGFVFIDDTSVLSAEDADAGEYLVYLSATLNGCTMNSDTITVIVNPAPVPDIFQEGNALVTPEGMNSYTWYYNGAIIGNSNIVDIQGNGNYAVFIETEDGCSGQSTDFIVTDVGVDELDVQVAVFPNPATEYITIELNANTNFEVKLYNVLGDLVLNQKISSLINQIDVSNLNNGSYVLQVMDENNLISKKIVINR